MICGLESRGCIPDAKRSVGQEGFRLGRKIRE